MERTNFKGLTTSEAEERLRRFGKNVLPQEKRFRAISIFFSQLPTFINLILFAAGVLAFVIGDKTDSILIFTILILNSLFGFVQEYRAEKALQKLKKLSTVSVRVLRDGKEKLIDSSFIVPGDLIILSEGDRIPADGVAINVNRLEVDESVLTGESLAVLKNEGDTVYSASLVSKGKAYMRTEETGLETKFGKIAKSLSEIEPPKTPLEKRLIEMGRIITIAVLLTSSFLVLLGIYKGEELFPLALLAISVAVSAIPESLPAVVTIALAIGVSRMARKRAIVRKLPSVETLGAVQVIVADKTGTLTENKMKVKKEWLVSKEPYDIILSSALNNSASLIPKTNGEEFDIVGDKTDGALLLWAQSKRKDLESLRKNTEILDEYLFDIETKTITTVIREDGR
ncbi:MAG: HAD-IC family P-type ATPase, partial [Patescibacteria group bacterium]